MKLNTIGIVHEWIKNRVMPGDLCMDATAGRGYDTALLCESVGANGQVIAFDIQEDAVDSTKRLLEERGLLKRAAVYKESHSKMDAYAKKESVACIMFNFGYLPGGDHSICTKAKTSIEAIGKGLDLLKKEGIMTLCIYHGGDSGFEEKEALMAYLKTIDSKKYTVVVSELYNKPNYPPIAVLIQKDKLKDKH